MGNPKRVHTYTRMHTHTQGICTHACTGIHMQLGFKNYVKKVFCNKFGLERILHRLRATPNPYFSII